MNLLCHQATTSPSQIGSISLTIFWCQRVRFGWKELGRIRGCKSEEGHRFWTFKPAGLFHNFSPPVRNNDSFSRDCLLSILNRLCNSNKNAQFCITQPTSKLWDRPVPKSTVSGVRFAKIHAKSVKFALIFLSNFAPAPRREKVPDTTETSHFRLFAPDPAWFWSCQMIAMLSRLKAAATNRAIS